MPLTIDKNLCYLVYLYVLVSRGYKHEQLKDEDACSSKKTNKNNDKMLISYIRTNIGKIKENIPQ